VPKASSILAAVLIQYRPVTDAQMTTAQMQHLHSVVRIKMAVKMVLSMQCR